MKRRTFLATASGITFSSQAASPEKNALRFGLITDIQYADVAPQGERHYRESLPKLDAILAHFAPKSLRFTLHLGDLIDRHIGSYAPVIEKLARLGHPCHHLLGNHDYDLTDSEKAQVVSLMKMPHDYYALYLEGWRLLMLDTNALSTYKHPQPDARTAEAAAELATMTSQKRSNAVPWGGACGKSQLLWLRRELTAAQAAGDRVILCAHHPLLPADAHQVWDAEALLAILKEFSCVKAWFNGHNHAGDYALFEGIHCMTFRSVLHQPEVNAAATIALFPDRIEIEGFGREPSRQLALR